MDAPARDLPTKIARLTSLTEGERGLDQSEASMSDAARTRGGAEVDVE